MWILELLSLLFLKARFSPINHDLDILFRGQKIPGLICVFSLRSFNRITECFLIHVQVVQALVTRKFATAHVN